MHLRPRRIVHTVNERLETRVNHAAFRFNNGLDWLMRDPHQVVGQTPYDVIYAQEKLSLRRYRMPGEELRGTDMALGTERLELAYPKYRLPVLMVPPLMVKPFIFDLWPERSFVLTLLRAGFDVYLVDFGEPDREDALIRLDNYVMEWIPAIGRELRRASGTRRFSMVGYCMGGLFSLMYAATHPDHSAANIVTIGAPVDFSKMGPLAWFVRLTHGQIERIAGRIGNIPGPLSSGLFKMVTPWKNMTRYVDLVLNMWNEEYVNGFDAMHRWLGEFIDYPAQAFQQFFRDFMVHNGLKEGDTYLGGKRLDLSRVDASLLSFAGRTDKVVSLEAAAAIMDLVSSRDKEFVVVPGGHMGVFAGSSAPDAVWKKTAHWLAHRSDVN